MRVWVDGKPAPQGSKRAFQAGGRVVVVEQTGKRLRPWRSDVRAAVEAALEAADPPIRPPQALGGAVRLSVRFVFLRPKDHHAAGDRERAVKPTAPRFPTSRNLGDVDKLLRGVLDALSGLVYTDDSQVVSLSGQREYGNTEGAAIEWTVMGK